MNIVVRCRLSNFWKISLQREKEMLIIKWEEMCRQKKKKIEPIKNEYASSFPHTHK